MSKSPKPAPEAFSIPRGGWTSTQQISIFEELKRIQKDPNFKRSQRCTSLLTWLVERSLSGSCEGLKERTVGVAVFGRMLDYDTNNDPIVRTAANEVRKRLAMYYQNPASPQQVKIRLVPGSYQPEFEISDSVPVSAVEPECTSISNATSDREQLIHSSSNEQTDSFNECSPCCNAGENDGEAKAPSGVQSEVITPAAHVDEIDLPFEQSPLLKRKQQPRSMRTTLWALGSLLLLFLLLAVSLVFLSHIRNNRLNAVWAPLLQSGNAPLICLAADTTIKKNLDSKFEQTVPQLKHAAVPTVSDIQTPASYSFTDLNIAHKVSIWLTTHGQQVALRQPDEITLWDFHHQPVILIGTAVNHWPSLLLANLRYTIGQDPASGNLWIRDARNPARTPLVQNNTISSSSAIEYAIVTRYLNVDTGNWLLSINGLGAHGTDAAGQLMSDHIFANELPDAVFRSTNFQLIVKTIVIHGKTGVPHVVESYFW